MKKIRLTYLMAKDVFESGSIITVEDSFDLPVASDRAELIITALSFDMEAIQPLANTFTCMSEIIAMLKGFELKRFIGFEIIE